MRRSFVLTIPRGEMMKTFGPAVAELFSVLAAQGVRPIGAVFAHHLTISPGMFDFELGVVVTAPVKESGRVKPGRLPAARVARTVYNGPYEGLPAAWGEFDQWMKANGHTKAKVLGDLFGRSPMEFPIPQHGARN